MSDVEKRAFAALAVLMLTLTAAVACGIFGAPRVVGNLALIAVGAAGATFFTCGAKAVMDNKITSLVVPELPPGTYPTPLWAVIHFCGDDQDGPGSDDVLTVAVYTAGNWRVHTGRLDVTRCISDKDVVAVASAMLAAAGFIPVGSPVNQFGPDGGIQIEVRTTRQLVDRDDGTPVAGRPADEVGR